MFFSNSRHTHRYPVAGIKSIGPYLNGSPESRQYMSTVTMKDGTAVIVYDDEIERLDAARSYIGVIPANAGYSILNVCVDDDPAWVRRTPVVAWLATQLGELVPVTAAGAWDDLQPFQPIEHPDARVYWGEQQAEYPSVQELIADMREQKQRASEQVAAKPVDTK